MTRSPCGFLDPIGMGGSPIPVSLFRSSETGVGELAVRGAPQARNTPSLLILYSVLRICQGNCPVMGVEPDPSILSRLDLGLLEFFWE
jgi:hypothetical protein